MITRPDVFDDEHLPRRLLHRDREVEQLLRAWSPTVFGQRGEDILLYGPHGVGKTALVSHTCERVATQGVETAQVDCMGESMAGIIRSVLQQLGESPGRTTPSEDLCLMLRERVDEPLIVVLDEADDLCESEALDRLNDVHLISWVIICHDPDTWLASADDWVRRRLHGTDIGIQRFSVDELADVLEARADLGLQEGVISRDQLEWIADDVAGNARRGIQVLREAAREATRQAHDRIRDIDIERAHPLAERRIRELNLGSLTYHHQILYELIRLAGGLGASELHDRYETVAEEVYRGQTLTPLSERARRRKLRKLREYDLVERVGENRYVEYHAIDEDVVSAEVSLPWLVDE